MPRIALQLTPDLVSQITLMFTGSEDPDVFGDSVYAVVEAVSHTEFNLKFMNADEIAEAASVDSDLTIVSL
jgi:hypothetical protein